MDVKMNLLLKIFISVFCFGFGFVGLFTSLLRLGWLRHRDSPWDLTFLHLNWLFHIQESYWLPHLNNILFLVFSVIAIILGFVSLLKFRST